MLIMPQMKTKRLSDVDGGELILLEVFDKLGFAIVADYYVGDSTEPKKLLIHLTAYDGKPVPPRYVQFDYMGASTITVLSFCKDYIFVTDPTSDTIKFGSGNIRNGDLLVGYDCTVLKVTPLNSDFFFKCYLL